MRDETRTERKDEKASKERNEIERDAETRRMDEKRNETGERDERMMVPF